MNIRFNDSFAPAEAERGKFAPIDMSTLSPAYPSAGRGRYAVLTYQVGSTVAPDVSGSPELKNNTVINKSLTINAGDLSAVDFGTTVNYIEVYNNDQRGGLPQTYLSLSDPYDYSTIESTGIILNKTSFYSVDFVTSTLWVAASGTGTVDLRIVGHRTV